MRHQHVTTICRHLARTPSANPAHVRISDKPMSVGATAIKSVKLFRGGRVGHPPPPSPPGGGGMGTSMALSVWPDSPADSSVGDRPSNRPVPRQLVLVRIGSGGSSSRFMRNDPVPRLFSSLARYHANRLRRGLVHRFLSPSTEFSARRVVARCAWMLSIFRNRHVSGDSVVCVGRLRAHWHRTVELHASSFKPHLW